MTTLTRVSAAAAMAAALIAGPALADKGGTPNGGNGTDNPHAAQPAQPAEPTVQPATPAEPAEQTEAQKPAQAEAKSEGNAPSEAAKPAKPAKPAQPAKGKSQGDKTKPAPAPAAEKGQSNSHAKAGKTTICHATGSETNPYVTITVSNNAIQAHDRHQHDEDIIPAPAGGCPGGTEEQSKVTPSGGDDKDKAGKTTICHATGSETNPFVIITISDNAVEAHAGHQDERDIIPAPEGGCPGSSGNPIIGGSQSKLESSGGETLGTVLVPAGLGQLEAVTLTPGDDTAAGGQPSVLGVSETSPGTTDEDVAAAAAPAVAETTRTREAKGLPFTGLELLLVVALGLAALLGGVALRRSLRGGQTLA